MKYILFAFFSSLFLAASAQIELSKTRHDFGNIMSFENRFVDIELKNSGAQKAYVLRIVKPREVVYVSTGESIEPGASSALRFQVNPTDKGKFSYSVDVFLSDRAEAVSIRLSGYLEDEPGNDMAAFTSCPDFTQQKAGSGPGNFKLTVVVIDKQSREVLPNSHVSLIQNGSPILSKKTDKNGKLVETVPLGFTYFFAANTSYNSAELGAYINFKRNYIILELDKNPAIGQPVPHEVPIDTALIVNSEHEKEFEEVLEENTEIVKVPESLSALDPNNFDSEYFKPVNVVFILDISSSMKQADKLELMKYALFQLADMLRPQDKMGIVTYANDAEVLLSPVSGADKENIKARVEGIKGGGMTAGGEGIKLGFKEALKSSIPDGTNHVIIITDGAFNRNSDDYKKHIKKYAKKGISMSVVGIKNAERDEAEMREAAELAKGRYIPIFQLADAKNNLRQEIRLITFRK